MTARRRADCSRPDALAGRGRHGSLAVKAHAATFATSWGLPVTPNHARILCHHTVGSQDSGVLPSLYSQVLPRLLGHSTLADSQYSVPLLVCRLALLVQSAAQPLFLLLPMTALLVVGADLQRFS